MRSKTSVKIVSPLFRLLVLVSFMVLTGCGMGRFRDMAASTEASNSSQSVSDSPETFADRVNEVSFYKTGSTEILLKLAVGLNGVIAGESEVSDPLCEKSGTLSSDNRDRLVSLLQGLKFDVSGGIISAGSGVELLNVRGRRGENLSVHLVDGEVPAGDFVSSNGEELSQFLKEIEMGLQLTCQ